MREKVNTAYFLNDPRKFASTEDGEKELNRLRAVCMRWKKKQTEDISEPKCIADVTLCSLDCTLKSSSEIEVRAELNLYCRPHLVTVNLTFIHRYSFDFAVLRNYYRELFSAHKRLIR